MNERINTTLLEACLAKEKAAADAFVASGDLDPRIAVFAFETQAAFYRQTAIAVNAGADDEEVYSARINLIANLIHCVATDTSADPQPGPQTIIPLLQEIASAVLKRAMDPDSGAVDLERSVQH